MCGKPQYIGGVVHFGDHIVRGDSINLHENAMYNSACIVWQHLLTFLQVSNPIYE